MVFKSSISSKPVYPLSDYGVTVNSRRDEDNTFCKRMFTICLLIIFPIFSLFVLFLGRLVCYNANEIGQIDYLSLYKRNIIIDMWETNFGPFLTNYYFGDRAEYSPSDIPEVNLPKPPVPTTATCDKFEDVDKFDCFPRGTLSEKDCNARGCCYVTSTANNVPFCYYPRGYTSYKYVSLNRTDRSLTAILDQQFKSPYPKDVPKLKLSAVFLTDEVLMVTVRSFPFICISLIT